MYTCMCNWVTTLYRRGKNCIGEITIKKENHGLGEETCGCLGGGGGHGRDWELGVNGCKLLLLECISNEILLYSTENCV